jgi:hypothetical protein
MSLFSFRAHLQATTDETAAMRPFVCDGNPYDCKAFIVGINPASRVLFWPFWSDETGFDKKAWLRGYIAERKARPLKPGRTRRQCISPTRRSIEWIVDAAAPTKILETNIYSVPTSRASELRKADKRTEAFEFLLSEIAPAVLLLHGKVVKEYFERHHDCTCLTDFPSAEIHGKSVKVAAVPQLFNASKARTKQLGEAIRGLCRET